VTYGLTPLLHGIEWVVSWMATPRLDEYFVQPAYVSSILNMDDTVV